MQGIERLLARGLPLKLKTVAVSINKHEVLAIQQFAEDLGLEFKFDTMMNPRIDCSQSPLAVRLTPEECIELDLVDTKRMDEWQLFAERFFGPVHTPETAHQLYHCGGGITSFAINPTGELSICVLSQQDLYPLKTGTFQAGWDQFLREVRGRPMTRPTKCVSCELKSMCGMCPATAELENGDPEEPVDFLCQVAHLRAHTLGLPVAPHGDCAYCAGGAGHDDLLAAAARLRQVRPGADLVSGPRRIPLQMTGAAVAAGGCESGGCSSCATHG
jgi:radical SAM protein with 4Fe4S-binding SPASM domain